MKKLLLALLVVTGFAASAPQAQADQYIKQFRGYDRCGRPVYSYVAVRACDERRSSYRADYDNYEAPRRSYVREYRCEPERRNYRVSRSRPLLSFFFGF